MLRLKKYFEQHFALSSSDWDSISPFWHKIQMPKNEFFIQEGKVCKQSGFILDGVMRYFTLDADGNEPTCYFSFEEHYIIDPFTFQSQQVSGINLRSVTDCSLAVLSFENDRELRKAFPRWADMSNTMLLKVSIEFANQKEMMTMNAAQRYAYFVKQYPQLAQRVPLQYVASYLGIAQPSLSRLRKELSQQR